MVNQIAHHEGEQTPHADAEQATHADAEQQFHWVAFTDHPDKVHSTRDSAAAWCLAGPLSRAGLRQGEIIIQQPLTKRMMARASENTRRSIIPGLKKYISPMDLLVVTGRPDLDPEPETTRPRLMPHSHTDLEKNLHDIARPYFSALSRSRFILEPKVAVHLPKGHPHYRCFRHYGTGTYVDSSDTSLFFIMHPAAWENGPSVMLLWGQGGCETMVWARILSNPDRGLTWIIDEAVSNRRPRFIMAQMTENNRKQRQEPPTDLRFTDTWDVKILLDLSLSADDLS